MSDATFVEREDGLVTASTVRQVEVETGQAVSIAAVHVAPDHHGGRSHRHDSMTRRRPEAVDPILAPATTPRVG